jgi:transmembrane sensor
VIPASFIDVNTDFNHFSAADFLSNDDFIAYQLNPDSDTAKNWQVWLSTTPPNVSEWNDAVYLLESIQLGLYNYSSNILSDEAILSLLQRIQQTNNEKQDHKVIIPLRPWKWIAAAVLLIFGALFLVRLLTKNEAKTYYSLRVTDTDKKHVERINNTGTSQMILLPDSSIVELAPGSKLAFNPDFNKADRIVYLAGEATFEVKKRSGRPFLVYANELVTRVLGTKFIIRAYDTEKKVLVDVLSGRVSVFREEADQTNQLGTDKNTGGLLLLPNQQAVFSLISEELKKGLVEQPVIITESKQNRPQFEYESEPIANVLRDLEKSYGISIRCNEDMLKGCELSASLTKESFDEKLEVICKTINAEYQKFDGQIIINAGGCN